MERLFRIDYAGEKNALRKDYPLDDNLVSQAFQITNPEIFGLTVRDFLQQYDWKIVFGRRLRDGEVRLVNWDSTIRANDIFMVVGSENDLVEVSKILGREAILPLEFNRRE